MKLLTVIIPCYNGEKYLSRCLKSLNGLDKKNVEILFVNDGSVDSSKTIIQNWVSEMDAGRIIDKVNGGYSSAINCGLDNCNTKYVMFLGVDDELEPDEINKICNVLRDNDLDILCFSTQIIDDNEKKDTKVVDKITCYSYLNTYRGSVFQLCKENKKNADILFTRDTSKIFNTFTIGSIRYFGKTGVSSDGCFSALVALKARTFFFSNSICYKWHLRIDSVSGRKKTLLRLQDEVFVWKTFFFELKNARYKEVTPQIVRMLRAYKSAVRSLKEYKVWDTINEHKKNIKTIVRWLLETKNLSIKCRVELVLPHLYFLVSNLLKK